jgi:hypothetical protein
MNHYFNINKYLRPIFLAIGMLLSLSGLSLMTLNNSTANSIKTPIVGLANKSELSLQVVTPHLVIVNPAITVANASATNPLATAFINAIPNSDGEAIGVYITGIEVTGNQEVFVNDIGPGGHRRSHALVISDTTAYRGDIIGFAPGEAVNHQLNLSTTLASGGFTKTHDVEYKRVFIQNQVISGATVGTAEDVSLQQTTNITVDNSTFTLYIVNDNTFSEDVYLVAMSSPYPPGAPPVGHSFVSAPYNISRSGARSDSDKIMTLKVRFTEPIIDNQDPHTLAILGWDQANKQWDFLEGNLYDDQNWVTLTTQRFRTYILATTTTWRDSFLEDDPTGVETYNQTHRRTFPSYPDESLDKIVLASGATTGTVTSNPVVPPKSLAVWRTVNFSATTSVSTGLTVDILDADDNLLLSNISNGADLSSLSVISYPALKLRAVLTSTTAGVTPELHDWQIEWEAQESSYIYLPLILHGQ